MKPSERIALWAERLRDLSAMGLRYAENSYDTERYRSVQDIAIEMFAMAADESPEAFEPLRGPVFSRPTPVVAGEAAIIDDAGRMLLIRRADNGKWAMPGGSLEVGETPAEGAVREALEETGVRCRPVALVGIFDWRLWGSASPQHLYIIVFVCTPLDGVRAGTASHAHEALETGWFAEDEMPDDVCPGHLRRLPKVFGVWRQERAAYFDAVELAATRVDSGGRP